MPRKLTKEQSEQVSLSVGELYCLLDKLQKAKDFLLDIADGTESSLSTIKTKARLVLRELILPTTTHLKRGRTKK